MADPLWCPTFYPERKDFSKPFTEFVREIFEKDPNLPAFKVVPPTGWRARRRQFPDLKDIKLATPIRQHAFGSKGIYRCIFVEHRPLNAAEFKEIAEDEEAAVPPIQKKLTEALKVKTNDELTSDDLMEREFWQNVTLNPPLYGADTPLSFFDPKVSYGWNIRNLGDLLRTEGVPQIQGVTTPMTYFGMWRSFFGWHKEDADLQSINFLHWGAPKVWYCVSPKDRAKFERLAENTFPSLRKACPAFIRHKDTLLTPTVLRHNGISFMQAKQYPGEFVVLNAAAYHCGFNLGFNCAEAINFATPEWIPVGKEAVCCRCSALKDGVRISMKLFDPTWVDPNDLPRGGEDVSSSCEQNNQDGGEDSSDVVDGRDHTKEVGSGKKATSARSRKAEASMGASESATKATGTSGGSSRSPKAKTSSVLAKAKLASALGAKRERDGSKSSRAAPSAKKPRTASGASAGAAKKPRTAPGAGAVKKPRQAPPTKLAKQRAAKPKAEAKAAAVPETLARKPAPVAPPPEARIQVIGVGSNSCRTTRHGSTGCKLSAGLTPMLLKEAHRFQAARELSLRGSPESELSLMSSDVVVGQPCAILGVDKALRAAEEGNSGKFFALVQRLQGSSANGAARKGKVMLRWLKEGEDGLFKPVPIYWEVSPEAILTTVRVKREQVGPNGQHAGDKWKLLTLPKHILATELVEE